jgi:hypothetical protein
MSAFSRPTDASTGRAKKIAEPRREVTVWQRTSKQASQEPEFVHIRVALSHSHD